MSSINLNIFLRANPESGLSVHTLLLLLLRCIGCIVVRNLVMLLPFFTTFSVLLCGVCSIDYIDYCITAAVLVGNSSSGAFVPLSRGRSGGGSRWAGVDIGDASKSKESVSLNASDAIIILIVPFVAAP